MIQRVQSLFFFFSAICSVTIVYAFPVLQDESTSYLLKEHFADARLFVFLSVALSVFAIFQFRNRKRQQLIASAARLMITIAFFIIVFFYREERTFDIGLFLFFIPYLTLFLAGYFVKKDEKLVKSADRIR
jgi:archaellum biogenesis protein FlaJ (TadC family)